MTRVPSNPMERLLWVDVESTGLDERDGVLLEVGFRITDLTLHQLANRSELIWTSSSAGAVERADQFVKDMHAKSGCIKDAQQYGIPLDDAIESFTDWMEAFGIGKDDPLCGSSVQFDRKWLAYHMPTIEARVSYRNIDLSTVKEMCRRYNPVLYGKLDEDTNPQKVHRVNPDLDDSINEAEFYIDNFLWVP